MPARTGQEKVKPLAVYLLVVCLLCIGGVFVVNLLDPPEPVLIIERN